MHCKLYDKYMQVFFFLLIDRIYQTTRWGTTDYLQYEAEWGTRPTMQHQD